MPQARLRAFADEVTRRTDTEAALQRMPRRSRPPTNRLVAIAACFILAVAIAAAVIADRQSVGTPPADSPTNTTDDGRTTLARGVVEFVERPVVGGAAFHRAEASPARRWTSLRWKRTAR